MGIFPRTMFPVLLEFPIFGGIRLYTYGLMAALGFLTATWWIARESKRANVSPERMMDLAFVMIVTAIIGSRLLFVVMNLSSFVSRPLAVFKIWEGGLVWYGGLIPCLPIAVWFVRRHHLSFRKVADIYAPAIALGHVFGRLGCLAAGCCYGRQAPLSHFWTLIFSPRPYTLAPTGVPLYASQLYEALGELLLFLFLVFWRRRRRFDGELIVIYLFGYSIVRILVEQFRGDLPRGLLGLPWLSLTQIVSFVFMGTAFGVFLWGRLREGRRGPER